MSPRSVGALLFLAIHINPTYGYGTEPHQVAAYVAAALLPKDVVESLQGLLGKSSSFPDQMADLAMWADSSEAGWSKYYHIAHTRPHFPDWDITRDCGVRGNNVCLATGIANWTSIAANPLKSRSARAESVKFLVHVMADLHQPLHVGLWKDLGGNKITDIFPSYTPGWWGTTYNLHQLWDRGLYLHLEKTELIHTSDVTPLWKALAQELILRLTANNGDLIRQFSIKSQGDITQYRNALVLPTRISTETVKVCAAFAYFDENKKEIQSGRQVSLKYIESRIEVMKIQLARAAVRLATLLVEIVARSTEDSLVNAMGGISLQARPQLDLADALGRLTIDPSENESTDGLYESDTEETYVNSHLDPDSDDSFWDEEEDEEQSVDEEESDDDEESVDESEEPDEGSEESELTGWRAEVESSGSESEDQYAFDDRVTDEEEEEELFDEDDEENEYDNNGDSEANDDDSEDSDDDEPPLPRMQVRQLPVVLPPPQPAQRQPAPPQVAAGLNCVYCGKHYVYPKCLAKHMAGLCPRRPR